MTPDDPRHGKNAGYLAHYADGETPCDPCRRGRYRDQKHLRMARARGERLTFTADELRRVVQPWLDQGFTPMALAKAVGDHTGCQGKCLCGRSSLASSLQTGHPVRRDLIRRAAAITEDSFPDSVKIPADLTRTRIYSLMAAGHPLATFPDLVLTGGWRRYANTSLGTARAVREVFQRLEATVGPATGSASKARRAGYLPPLAWDDPGTLAWPKGWDPTPAVDTLRDGDAPLLEEYDDLVALTGSMTTWEAANRLGVKWPTLEKALARRAKQDAA